MSLEKTMRALDRALAMHTHALNTDEPALVEHASIAVIVTAIVAKPTPWSTKEALTRALIREHRREVSPIYGCALLVAYQAVLRGVRAGLWCETLDREDLDQVVIEAFLEAVMRFDDAVCPDRVVMHLRQGTARAVYRLLLLENRRFTFDTELARCPDLDAFDAPLRRSRLTSDEIEGCADTLRDLAADTIEPRKLELVIDTCLRGIPLRVVVSDPRDYERVKRDRTRTLARIRTVITARIEPPCDEIAWLRGDQRCA